MQCKENECKQVVPCPKHCVECVKNWNGEKRHMTKEICLSQVKDFFQTNSSTIRYTRLGHALLELDLVNTSITNESRNVYDRRYAKFRTSEARVLRILNLLSAKWISFYYHETVIMYKENCYWKPRKVHTLYQVNEIVRAHQFDGHLEQVCTSGIHYFISLEAAYYYEVFSNGRISHFDDDGFMIDEQMYKYGIE
jgi:hypothetical protein